MPLVMDKSKSKKEVSASNEYALFKETKSASMNIFRKIFFSKNGVCKSRIKLCFHNKSVHYS